MQKIISFLMIFVLCMGQINVMAKTTEDDSIIYYINEDFSTDKTLEEAFSNAQVMSYTNRNGAVSVKETFIIDDDPVDEDSAEVFDGYALRAEVKSTVDYDDMPYIIARLPQNANSGRVVVETRLRSFVPDANYMMTLRNSDDMEISSAVFRTSMMLTLDPVNTITYKAGEWYDIKFVVDLDNKLVDGYVNDKLYMVNYYSENITNLSSLLFRGWVTPPNSGIGEIKYIKVYEEPSKDLQKTNLDSIDEKYREKLAILNMLGISNDEMLDFDANKIVTRARFAEMLPKLHGLSDEELSIYEKAPYEDVDESSPLRKYIDYAYNERLMVGNGNGIFAPDSTIQYQDAVKALLSALKYDSIIDASSYPGGYILMAKRFGLLDETEASGADNLTYGDFVTLMYNALINKIPVVDSVQEGGIIYETQDGITAMTEYFGMHMNEGIVTANGITGIESPKSAAGEGRIKINGETFKNDNSQYDDFIGMYVRYYYIEDDINTIKFIAPCDNDILEIAADDIDVNRTKSAGGNYFCYFDEKDGKVERISLNKPYIIYNGVAYDGQFIPEVICPTSGNVKLINNDGDKKYDVIIINSYKNIIVSAINADKDTIYGMYGEEIELKGDFSVIRAGKKISLSELVKWDVLAVAESVNKTGGKYTKIFVLRDKFQGEISLLSDDSVFIDGNEYKFSKEYVAYMQKINERMPSLNDGGIFYMDIEGKILGCDSTGNSYYKIGYLLNVSESKGLDRNVMVKLVNSSGQTEVLKVKSKVEYNTSASKTPAELLTCLKTTAMIGEYGQLVRYSLDSEDRIASINTEDFEVYNPEGVSADKISTEHAYGKAGRVFYRNQELEMQKPFTVGAGTIGFYIPSIDAEDKDYDVISFDTLDSQFYNVEAYNLSDAYCAEIVVFRQYSPTVQSGDPCFLVDRIFTALDEDGETVTKVTGYKNGVATTLIINPESGIAVPKQGDIIRYLTKRSGEVSYISKVMNSPDSKTEEIAVGGYGETDITRYGKLTFVDDDSIVVEVNGIAYPFSRRGLGDFVVVDLKEDKITKIDKTNIDSYTYDRMDNARIFVKAYQGTMNEAIVYLLEE